MSDISFLLEVYGELKSIKSEDVCSEKANIIVNKAYTALEEIMETKENTTYLKKTRELLNEVDNLYLSRFCLDEGLEESIDLSSCPDHEKYRTILCGSLSSEIIN